MKVTIKDIAKNAGVSPGTVSKILTGRYKEDNVQISPKTIEKVKKIAKKLNYVPNYAARLLITGRTFTIGIYIPKSKKKNFFFEHYYSQIVDSIEKISAKNGYDILLINYNSYINKFKEKKIDGLIIIEQWEIDNDIMTLIKEKKNFVIINNLIENKHNIYSVNIDNEKAIEKIVKHFINNNHKNLAFIGELTSKSQKEHKIRLNHFISQLEKNNLPVKKELLLLGKTAGVSEKINESDYDQLSGYYGIEYLVKNHYGKFTGVFCANDLIALGAINYLHKNGIKVPDEISIIGFDDLDFSKYITPGLTTIKQPFNILGQEAFILLLKIINNKPPKEYLKKIEPELIIRNTVKCI